MPETQDEPTSDGPTLRRRNPWLAALLGLLFGPLGQIYTGHLRRALFVLFTGICLMAVLSLFAVAPHQHGFVLIFAALAIVIWPIWYGVDAFLLARRNKATTRKPYQRWWVYLGIAVILSVVQNLAVMGLREFVAEAFMVPTRSMSPTIVPGDRIVVDKFWYRLGPIQRNDLVVFHMDGLDSPLVIKRVVGLPGDEVEIRNEKVFVNGEEWPDHHAVFVGNVPTEPALIDYGPEVIDSEHYFLLGDNRRMSNDSRLRGTVPLSDVTAVVRFIYFSQERKFPNPNDTDNFESGRIQWERIGQRLD